MSKDYLLGIAVLAGISLLSAFDIIYDLVSGEPFKHVVAEVVVFAIALGGIGFIVREYLALKSRNIELMSDLEKTGRDLEVWRNDAEKYLAGLGDAIDKQMTRWEFTPAEKEVGLLLLKGFSFKEIAALRDTSERTARQQSLEIYRKSGLAGRAEFSAFFLEDLLLPKSESKSGFYQ